MSEEDGDKKRAAPTAVAAPPAKKPSQAALQQQIQQQLQAQLQQQLQAAAARGQQANITPEQIQAQAQAMVQAAAQAQAVVAAAKSRGDGLVPMNSAQIQALSQIQAQAIVNARKSSGSPQQIQTQIQLQAQALVHAHTQAQIAAGIYKGDAPTPAPAAAKKDDQPLLTSFTPSQMQQQQELTNRHQEELRAMKERHAAADASDAEKNKKEEETLQASHKEQVEELHATFRKQNAAAEYAGVKQVATVPNPTGSSAPVPAIASIPPAVASVPSLSSSTALALPEGFDGELTLSATSPQFLAKLNGILNNFWSGQLQQVQQLPPSVEQDFKNHNDLPLARIKRIMKSDEDVRMISAEAPVLFAKACELFILELTVRSWTFSQHHKRRTLQKEDIKEAIQRTDIYDFLVDVIQ